MSVFRGGTQQPQMGGGEGYKYPSPKTSRWELGSGNSGRRPGYSGPQKIAVRFKIGPETLGICLDTPGKVSIAFFSETPGISGIKPGCSGIPTDSNLREKAITFYSGLGIR